MTKIVMIGTIHTDIDGESRLNRILTDIAPDLVICEGLEEQELEHQKYVEVFRSLLSNSGMNTSVQRKLLELSTTSLYEGRTAKMFCEKSGTSFSYFNDSIDIPTDKEIEDRAKSTLEIYSALDPEKALELRRKLTAHNYAEANIFLNTPNEDMFFLLYDPKNLDKDGFGHRDKKMEDFLRQKIAVYPNATIATVTGFSHILQDPRNVSLYCRIRDLNPKRRLIG